MDDIQFKPRAYEKLRSIEALEEDVEDVYRRGGIKALMEIPGIGESIAEKIEELIKTERLDYYEKLKEKVPVDIGSLSGVEGLGPRMFKTLWQELGIRNIRRYRECLHHAQSVQDSRLSRKDRQEHPERNRVCEEK